jgi:hypothetical protein
MRMRTITAIVAAPAIAGAALLAGTGAASAAPVKPAPAPKPVIASTYEAGLVDTTSVPTGTDSSQGPVWAYDDMTRVVTARQTAPGTWTVTFDEGGVYNAIANPLTGAAWHHAGLFGGTISYVVTSAGQPKAANLPRTEPATATHSSVMAQLFGAPVTVTGGGSYSYTYLGIPGAPKGVYTQVG